MNTIKIFLSYHDKHPLIKTDTMFPIQTGCADASLLFDGMLRDDIGDNISIKNCNYNELTAQYWVWKNADLIGNPNYIGFMHYRRHFMFDGFKCPKKWHPEIEVSCVPYIDEKYLSHFSDGKIERACAEYDCIVLKPYDVHYVESENLKEQFGKLTGHPVHFDVMIQVAKELYPDYISEIEKIEKGSVQYLCNMFVMKKDLANRYNEFCFNILFETERRIKLDKKDRDIGYLAEFVLSMFIFKLIKEGVKILELPGSYILSDHKPKFLILKCYFYFFISRIIFGKARKTFKRKYRELKELIQIVKSYKYSIS